MPTITKPATFFPARHMTRREGDTHIRQIVVDRGGNVAEAEEIIENLKNFAHRGTTFIAKNGELITVNPKRGRGRGAHYLVLNRA